MPDLTDWIAFLAVTVTVLLIPGPSVLFVVARGIEGGFRAVVRSAVGLAAGDLLQVGCAAAGLSALFASSATLFTVVKYAGAGYLIYLGIRRLLDRRSAVTTPTSRGRAPRSVLAQGFVVNALNPKTALFYLALLPQFVDPANGPIPLQVMLLGMLFVVLGFGVNLTYGRLATALGDIAHRARHLATASRYASGTILIVLGILASLTEPPRHPGAAPATS